MGFVSDLCFNRQPYFYLFVEWNCNFPFKQKPFLQFMMSLSICKPGNSNSSLLAFQSLLTFNFRISDVHLIIQYEVFIKWFCFLILSYLIYLPREWQWMHWMLCKAGRGLFWIGILTVDNSVNIHGTVNVIQCSLDLRLFNLQLSEECILQVWLIHSDRKICSNLQGIQVF